jgi:hypothetical protein
VGKVRTATEKGGKKVKHGQEVRGKVEGAPRVSWPIRKRGSCLKKGGSNDNITNSTKQITFHSAAKNRFRYVGVRL